MVQHDPAVLLTERVNVRLVLRDGRVLFGVVVAARRPGGPTVGLRPWGCSRVLALDVADIRIAGPASVHRWSEVRKITNEQAHTWSRSA